MGLGNQKETTDGFATADGPWPILPSRLDPPLSSPYEVPRLHVCDQIFSAGGSRLVLIAAPAGFGKTTVMRRVRLRCQSGGLASAWLNLEAGDNDMPRFLAGLAAALESVMPGISAALDATPFDGGGGRFAGHLLQRVAKHDEAFVLFLDDFEVVQSAALLTYVRQMIQCLPAGAQLIVGSRNLPELGLGRLRASAWLFEIGAAQLRFSLQETAEFLRTYRKLTVSDEEVERLHERTEGWAAALWLASLALSSREPGPSSEEAAADFIRRFSGSDAAIGDYLAEDVLARLPEEVRTFLLRTSILNPLNASLCNAVCGRQDSQDRLEQLERANLFLARLDDHRSNYRYHGLFAEYLRGQLQRIHAGEVPALHRSAAVWYQTQGRLVPALEHALASGDLDYALPILADNALRLLSDARMRLLTRWLGGVPPERLNSYPMLCVIHAWAVNFTRGPREAMILVELAEGLGTLDHDALAHLYALKAVLLLRMDRIEDAYELGLANFHPSSKTASFVNSILATALGTISIIRGDHAEAQSFLIEARRIQAPMEGSFSVVLSESVEAAMDLLRGRLRQAIARLRGTVEARSTEPSRYAKANALAGILLADALYEIDEHGEAEALLTGYLPSITEGGLPDQLITAHVLMARLLANRGEYDQAYQLIMELEYFGHRLELPRAVASAKLERARLALGAGSVEAAGEELESAADPKLWQRVTSMFMVANDVDTYDIARLRWWCRSGRATEALAPLTLQLEAAERAQRMRRALKLRILLAEALHATDQRDSSFQCLGKALMFGATEGFIRTFTDEGQTVIHLIHDWSVNGGAERAGVPRAYIDRLLRDTKRSDPAPGEPRPTPQIEMLSRKEVVVLRLLAEGHSNRELAQRLVLSETTVRTHLRNINFKLAAHSRLQAVAVARLNGIIA